MDWNEFLREANAEDDVELVEHALREGADPNYASGGSPGADGDLQTPLYWAASGGRVPIVQMLMTWGARVAAEQGHESTSLHEAVEHNDAAIVDLLLAADGGAALDWFDYVDRTPLMIAVKESNASIARMLIDAGANVDTHCYAGFHETALHMAATKGSLPMARLLVESGANPHVPDNEGSTPLDQAGKRTDEEGQAIYALLEQAARSK